MKVIGKGHYVVKVDLCHVYGSVSAHLVNYHTLGLKWHFSGCKHYTYLANTQWWDRLLGTFNGSCDIIDSRPATDICFPSYQQQRGIMHNYSPYILGSILT